MVVERNLEDASFDVWRVIDEIALEKKYYN